MAGLWFPSAGLDAGEQVLFSALGNTFQGWRTVGCRVVVTNRRLLAIPNYLDRLIGGRRREVDLELVRAVSVAAPGRQAIKKRGFGAALRPQIEVAIDGQPDLVLTVTESDALIDVVQPR